MNDEAIPYHIGISTRAGVGDCVCLLSACREFTRRTGSPVYANVLPDVVATYQDPNLRFGTKGARMIISPMDSHRSKNPGDYVNYYGTYLASLGLLRRGDDPKLELPKFEVGESYAVIQPFSVFAQNPSQEYLQNLVDNFTRITGMKLHVVGKADTPRVLKNVEYDLLQDGVVSLMRIIQDAAFVLAPRSSCSHLAAGYGRRSFIWVPDDGENWHLNYTGWPRVLHSFEDGTLAASEVLKLFLRNVGLRK